MPSYESHRHNVGTRTFVVLEESSDPVTINGMTAPVEFWRTVRDANTGEVVQEFRRLPNMSLPPYDYAAGQQWLEKKYSNPTVTYVTNFSSGTAFYTNSSISATIANANHSHATTVANPASADHNKEQDMALRHEFTFPYTGQEIADALTAQIDAYTAQIDSLETIDISALKLLSSDVDYAKATESKTKRLRDAMDKLVRERAPYLKAAKQSFDLDLEDIEHFKLDVEAAPARPKRTRRTKAEIEAAKAPSAA